MRNRAAEAEMTLGVDVKPAGPIVDWDGWPEDVRRCLWVWNSHHRRDPHSDPSLSFYRRGIFDCAECGERCEPAESGVAYLAGRWLCDDCLIARARQALAGQADNRKDDN